MKKLLSFIFAFILILGGHSFASAADQYSANLIPKMTSNTTPSGVVYCSDYVNDYFPWKAFDYNSNSIWLSSGQSQWLSYEFPSAVIVNKYVITQRLATSPLVDVNAQSPRNWSFEASNDGTNWVVLDTQKAKTAWNLGSKTEFPFVNSTPYKLYRLYVSANNGGPFTEVDELEMMSKIATPPATPLNLNGTAGDKVDHLTWETVSDATGYNVKRSTTPGGPYTTIGNVTGTSYDDTDVTNGTTYYYVVTAVNTDGESANSNEVALTPQGKDTPPPATGDKALLRITMTNGEEKEYDLTATQVGEFVNWYQNHSTGDKPAYVFNKTYNVGPFTGRTEYVAFERIQSFEVMEYNQK